MKRQVQETGVRVWFGDDFINMQNELYAGIEAFGKAIGSSFLLSGCEITDAGGGNYSIADGYAFIYPDDGVVNDASVVRVYGGTFASAQFPLYINLATRDKTEVAGYGRVYGDSANKNIIVEKYGLIEATGNAYSVTIPLTGITQVLRSVIQDATHRFVTDTEKTTWNAKYGTAAGVLAALLTVDGSGSGLDADKIDGYHFRVSGGYLQYSSNGTSWTSVNMSAADILTALLTVDGTGSGLDADKLDGAEPATAATANTIAKRDSAGALTVTDIIIA